jgi:hypothetical protein
MRAVQSKSVASGATCDQGKQLSGSEDRQPQIVRISSGPNPMAALSSSWDKSEPNCPEHVPFEMIAGHILRSRCSARQLYVI